MNVPGLVWVSIIVTLATTLGPWADQYVGKPFGPLIVIVLAAAVKGLTLWVEMLKAQAAVRATAAPQPVVNLARSQWTPLVGTIVPTIMQLPHKSMLRRLLLD
jgi:hypothetical protein